MTSKAPSKLIGQLKQPQYALLRELTDAQTLDAASLEGTVNGVVNDRFALARGLIEAARILANSENQFARRSAVSRAYYGAYHAARATVFAIRRHDEDDHEELPRVVDLVLEGQAVVGAVLKELRQRRNEMDYSPYPGPSAQTQWDAQEIEEVTRRSVEQAEDLVEMLERYLQERR